MKKTIHVVLFVIYMTIVFSCEFGCTSKPEPIDQTHINSNIQKVIMEDGKRFTLLVKRLDNTFETIYLRPQSYEADMIIKQDVPAGDNIRVAFYGKKYEKSWCYKSAIIHVSSADDIKP